MRRTEAHQGVRMSSSGTFGSVGGGGVRSVGGGGAVGVSERTFRRWRGVSRRRARRDCGTAGWARSPKRVPADREAEVEALYRERYRLHGQAFSRAAGRASRLRMGLHVDEDASAFAGPVGEGAARGASAQASAPAAAGHDAASGRLAARLARRPAGARSDRDAGRRDERDLVGVPGRGGRHGFDVSGIAGGVRRARAAAQPLHRSRQPLFPHAGGRRQGRPRPSDAGGPGARRIWASSISRPIRRRRAAARSGPSGPAGPVDEGAGAGGRLEVEAANAFIRDVYFPATTRALRSSGREGAAFSPFRASI